MKFLVILILLFLAYKALRRSGYIKVYKHNFQKPQPQAKPEGTVTIENKSNNKNEEGFTNYTEVKD
jgi:hypothetical protein